MTELRRTNNLFVGVLRTEREYLDLRSRKFVTVATMNDDSVKAGGSSMFIEAPPL